MGSFFIINISKGFLENKVETLAIYKLIMSMYMKRYFERGDYWNYFSREGLIAQLQWDQRILEEVLGKSLFWR